MRLLLAFLPYLAASAVYLIHATELFRTRRDTGPEGWVFRLVAPLLISGLMPLTLAARGGFTGDEQTLLALGSGIPTLVSIIIFAVLRAERAFSNLRLLVPVGWNRDLRVRRWHILVVVGLAVIWFAAVINIYLGTK